MCDESYRHDRRTHNRPILRFFGRGNGSDSWRSPADQPCGNGTSMTVETWLLFCVTETVLCFTPGPAVLLVVSLALTRGARAGLGGSIGILAANAGYFILSGTGIGAILLEIGRAHV